MLFLSQSVKFIRKGVALLLLPLLASSCQWVMDDYDDELTADASVSQYINITISVSTATNPVTRANPTGGEEGDGREKGIVDRENKVDHVTIIFYRNANGLNASEASAQATPIDFVGYYETTLDENYTPVTGTHYPDEIYYTTGEQELPLQLQSASQYRIIVVANADLTNQITVGDAAVSNLATVREMMRSGVYADSGVGIDAKNFIMTSEKDDELNYSYSIYNKTLNRRTLVFDNIHIERMAARIDFWANNSNGYKTSSDDSRYENTPGYEYTIYKPGTTEDTGDRFVLTSITPFNLNNGDEYLLKRVTTGFGENSTTTWLGNETLSNYVLDPHTTAKTSTTEHPTYFASTLTSVISDFSNSYTITMASQHPAAPQASPILNVEGKDNIILCYPKENTLQPGVTSLYYYATGLAFEGYYYQSGKTTGERRVYYYFIRHQGEQNTAYDVWTPNNIEDAKTTLCPSTTAMNYGIVRNNIYRISVNKVAFDAGTLELSIAVHDWRNVEHPIINI